MELSLYQNIIHNRTYAREKGNRLEYFDETVDRYVDYLKNKFNNPIIKEKIEKSRLFIYEQKSMPSMRLFFSAGDAVEAENAMAFGCKFQSIDSLKSFSDLLYSLLCTCGVGVSVQHKYINSLPKLPNQVIISDEKIVVEDSRGGWAKSLEKYLLNLFNGISYKFDTSNVRDKGAKLIISGGYASGPEPFNELRQFIEDVVLDVVNNNKSSRLSSTNIFDFVCKIAQCAVQGGVRRAAIITLFDEFDDKMFEVKSKENLIKYPHRYNSNNTMVYSGKDVNYLLKAIKYAKINGEPGILFEENMYNKMAHLGRFSKRGYGVNPCGEIVLRPNQFCNLVEAIIRAEDTLDDIIYKLEVCVYLALAQATLTDYKYISNEVKQNQEDDPIVGISLTGLCDNELFHHNNSALSENIKILKDAVNKLIDENWKIFGLKSRPKGTTCIKPSGTVSQIVDSSSGVHPRYAHYYVRRVLIGSDSPLYESLKNANISYLEFPILDGRVFEFPMKAPSNSITTDDMTAIDQLKYVSTINEYWCDFNASVTIYVKHHEWNDVIEFLKSNKNTIAVSFLPYEITADTSGFLYLPYEEIDEEKYYEMNEKFQNIRWEDIMNDQANDKLADHREFACSGGVCSI